ncbi:MAG: hypothetical protein GY708_15385 [Actinomycetia bacterium]|nr:hypothetical protein [Actinomycetes bacterium]MCP4963374.1 hypothetical protein [Actinomycetes bacterium]
MTITLETIDKEKLQALLLRNWMTHDAMWFMHSVQELGIERANQLNRAAVHDMAAIEAVRIAKLAGLEGVRTLDDVRQFVDAVIELVMPDFLHFDVKWSPDNNSVQFEISKCFAYEGVAGLGVAAEYECGIYERIYGWLDALGLEYQATPTGPLCSMHHTGSCVRMIEITFGDRDRQEANTTD